MERWTGDQNPLLIVEPLPGSSPKRWRFREPGGGSTLQPGKEYRTKAGALRGARWAAGQMAVGPVTSVEVSEDAR